MLISNKMQPMLGGNSAIRAMFEEGLNMAKKYGKENVYDFSLGNPNVPAPAAVNETIKELVDTVDSTYLHGYMPNAGYPETRKAIADSLNRRFGTDFAMNNIIMTVGAASGLNAVLKTVVDPGSEVIVFKPYFLEYKNYVKNYDGVLTAVPTIAETSLPDIDAFAAALNAKTKAVIINTPNNPTGVIYGEDVIKAIATKLEEAEQKFGTSILLIADEPYRELAYDGFEVPFLTKYYHNAVVCYSYSKSLSLPGERIGYIAVPNSLENAEDFISIATICTRVMGSVNAPSLMQKVIEKCVDTDVTENVAVYDRNRKKLYEILKKYGFTAVYPQGAFYMWIKTPVEDKAFVDICKKHRILVVNGSSFEGPGFVRAAYCVSEETITRSEESWKAVAEEVGLI